MVLGDGERRIDRIRDRDQIARPGRAAIFSAAPDPQGLSAAGERPLAPREIDLAAMLRFDRDREVAADPFKPEIGATAPVQGNGADWRTRKPARPSPGSMRSLKGLAPVAKLSSRATTTSHSVFVAARAARRNIGGVDGAVSMRGAADGGNSRKNGTRGSRAVCTKPAGGGAVRALGEWSTEPR